MSYSVITRCRICSATEYRTLDDEEDIPKHTCRASTVGQAVVSL